MTTQAQMILSTRDRLNESTPAHWTDSMLRRWINEGMRDIARKTECIQDRDTIPGIIGTSEYTLASDIIRVHRVEFQPLTDRVCKLEYLDVKNLDMVGWEQRDLQSHYPFAYTIWGTGLVLKLIAFPSPSTAGAFTIWHFKVPVALAESGSTDAQSEIPIPEVYDDLLLDYIEYRALRRDRDPSWQEAKALYDEGLQVMFDTTRRWVDEGGLITPQGAGGSLPTWLTSGGY
jgi:hypothetical protein